MAGIACPELGICSSKQHSQHGSQHQHGVGNNNIDQLRPRTLTHLINTAAGGEGWRGNMVMMMTLLLQHDNDY